MRWRISYSPFHQDRFAVGEVGTEDDLHRWMARKWWEARGADHRLGVLANPPPDFRTLLAIFMCAGYEFECSEP